ncbi:P-loop NTPase family protein [Haladaptatus caseinilyticus]|uniref:hypothetical protein n=1 Tax=Haladaptatus caseinilyticus TaxID=2993314 RepID=UPI00224A7C87|nr:hypothetical protein [Haladaptatus caseinilyticus]
MMDQQTPTLPTLDDGVTILNTDKRATGALHSLVLDHLLLEDGSAIWIDAHGHGTTQPLMRIAPSMHLLERIRIARAFTPWQHQSLLCALPAEITDETTLVVLPSFDWFYRSDDLSDKDGERMLSAGVDFLTEIADTLDAPILVTQQQTDSLTAPIREITTEVVRCEQTKFGPRFAGDDYETLVYPLGDGTVQTTFAFWKRVLTTRHPAITGVDTRTEVSVNGAY